MKSSKFEKGTIVTLSPTPPFRYPVAGLFDDLLTVLGICKEDLTPYRGTDLSSFNGSKTRPLGYTELMLLTRTIKTPFLVLLCPLLYNCNFGRSTLGQLEVVVSTVHLKMKFYSVADKVIT